MSKPRNERISILRQYNPWWQTGRVPDLPGWHRKVFRELWEWMTNPPTHRAVLLSGTRQVGKTTLLLQTIQSLLQSGVPAASILYVTFDHPMLKAASLEEVTSLWREVEPKQGDIEYLFLDEIQYAKDWQVWLKHQVDFQKARRIAVTGSATPLATEGIESGAGRWHTIRLGTLSFFEYLQIRQIAIPALPDVKLLDELFNWTTAQFTRTAELAKPLVGHFHEYLLHGGFPQTALIENITVAQRLLREDIVDKVLRRDMTALFGVRRVMELEQTFLYLCLHDGGLLDIAALCRNLQVKKPTVLNFLALLEATHLIHRLPPFGYGKEVLRGQHKVYLADASIAPSILLRGKSLLEDTQALGTAVETAFVNHVIMHYAATSSGLAYWKGTRGIEVDIIVSTERGQMPFEVKYQSQPVTITDIKGLLQFCSERKVAYAYVVSRDITNFEHLTLNQMNADVKVIMIPAALACYWLGRQA